MSKNKKTTYKYKREESILNVLEDQYELSEYEYNKLYKFFVTYSMCENQSNKKRTLEDYGWASTVKYSEITKALKKSIGFDIENFVFRDDGGLKDVFEKNNLIINEVTLDSERGVIGKTNEKNQLLKLFHRIRNIFSHGRFVMRLSGEDRYVIMEDKDSHNVTARIVIKLDTLTGIVDTIDKNHLTGETRDTVVLEAA